MFHGVCVLHRFVNRWFRYSMNGEVSLPNKLFCRKWIIHRVMHQFITLLQRRNIIVQLNWLLKYRTIYQDI